MRTSRKGTRLNEAYYFRQPLPHARKKITSFDVMPYAPTLPSNPTMKFNPNTRTKARKKYVDVKQPSIEIAVIEYMNPTSKANYLNERLFQEKFTSIEKTFIDIAQLVPDSKTITENTSSVEDTNLKGNVGTIIADNPIDVTNFEGRQSDDELFSFKVLKHPTKPKHLENDDKCTNMNEIMQENNPNKLESDLKVDVLQEQKAEENDKQRRSSWWKYGSFGQTIYNFFAQILGRKATPPSPDYKSEKSPLVKHLLNQNNNNVRSKRNQRKDIIQKIQAKKVQTYVINNGRMKTATNHEKSDEEVASIIMKQIQRTRDKNLRITLLERELNSRIKGKVRCPENIKERLTSRRLSSPLC